MPEARQESRRRISGPMDFQDAGGKQPWLLALTTGVSVYKGQQLDLGVEDLHLIADETRRALLKWRNMVPLGAEPYRPPVLIEHRREGRRFGDVLDLKVEEVAGEDGEPAARLWVRVSLTWEAQFGVDQHEFKYVSVKLVPDYVDQDGETYQLILEELTLTVNPFFKHLGTIQQTAKYEMSEQAKRGLALAFSAYDGEDEMELAEQVAQMAAKLEQMESKVEALTQAPPKAPEAPGKVEVQASDAQEPGWVKRHIEALDRNTAALTASGATPEIGKGGLPPAPSAPAPTTVMGAIRAIMASDGVDEMTAAEISARRYPHLF